MNLIEFAGMKFPFIALTVFVAEPLALTSVVTADTVHFEGIEIEGSPAFINQVKGAIGLLRLRSPDTLRVVKSYVGRIRESRRSGMAAYEDPPTFNLSMKLAESSLTWCAASIAHDAYHSKLYHEYRQQHGEPVPYSTWCGQAREQQCNVFQAVVMREIKAPSHEIQQIQGANGTHYDVDGDGYHTLWDGLLQDW